MLQSAPAIIFTLFAGPLSDTYGRKPLIICALFGYFVLNLVFLINSIWFYELKVEYLLFECLQDFTGGGICFYLASYSYMVDITKQDTRTRRLSLLDSFLPIGFTVGLLFGTYIKNNFGLVTLYSVAAGIIFLAMVYMYFLVKDSRKTFDAAKMKEARNTKSNIVLGCNKDFFPGLLRFLTVGIKTVFKKRPNGRRSWVICFVLIFCLSKGIDSGSSVVNYMFYRLQYKVTNTIYSNLFSFLHILMFFSQIAVVPFLSGVLKFRDTSILMLAVLFNIVAQFIVAFNNKIWVLYICYVLWMLLNTITTTSRSNLSKLMDSTEIGKAFSVLGIIQALLPVATKPAFAFLYKMTLETCPATYKVLTGSLYCIVLGLLVYTHFGLKRMDARIAKSDPEELKELNTRTIKKECKNEYSTVYDDVTKQKCNDLTNDVCNDVLNNVCNTVQKPVVQTEYREECCTDSVSKCHTEHDTVTRRDCKLEHEEQCYTVPREDCNLVKKTLTETFYDNKCNTVYDNKCETIVEQQCKPFDEQVCNKEPQETCKDVTTQQCSTITEKECKTVTKNVCKMVHYDEVCSKESTWECNDVPKQKCWDEPRKQCNTEYVESCRAVSSTKCNNVSRQSCKDVAREACAQVPRQVSKVVEENMCNTVDLNVCRPVPKEVCNDIHEKVPREVCVNKPKQTCEQKPHQVTKYVDEWVCNDVTTTSCKPVTTTNCHDSVEKVPRQQANEVCVDKPEEKCWDENTSVTSTRKEHKCWPVEVETCTTVRHK